MAIRKVSALSTEALDWAVVVAEDFKVAVTPDSKLIVFKRSNITDYYNPSTNWGWGGPIIEREKISTAYEPSLIYDDSCRWKALCAMSDKGHTYGPTPLIAAMRCYVASKLGDEVDVPERFK
jgi:hypothetical protein